MKIYDCFTFYNELDMLEIRLNILDKYVDYFVLVEATKTHSGQEKKLYYKENEVKFKKFKHKIIHIIVNDMPIIKDGDRWKLENFQRDSIMRGLTECQQDDIILVSDLDEIPNPKEIQRVERLLMNNLKNSINRIFYSINRYFLKNITKNQKIISYATKNISDIESSSIVIFKQKLFYYYLNGFVNDSWLGTRAVSYQNLVKYFDASPQKIRIKMSNNILNNGGWHFSYLFDPFGISLKIKSFAHSEFDSGIYTDEDEIKKKIEDGSDLFGRQGKIKYINVDCSYPLFILENIKKYSKLIKSV